MTKQDDARPTPLSGIQRRAVFLLAAGRSVTEAAKEVGVARQTLSKWQGQPEFQRQREALTDGVVRQSRQELRALAVEATATVREVLRAGRTDSARIQAARLVLDSVGIFNQPDDAPGEEFGTEFALGGVVAAIAKGEPRVARKG